MKFVLTLLFMLFLVLSPSSRAIAQGSFAFANAGVQVNQHASKQRLKVRSSKQAAQMARIDNWNSGFALGDKRLGDEHFAH
mgnify:CR=1 FL=1